jgi:cell division septation protein DedD
MLVVRLMRDAHRMKEKYDLSLDSRQVVSLLVGGIVVLGAVFVLGVLVGKKLAGNQRTERTPDLLAALDTKSDALERARAAPPLTFQEELTRASPPATTKPPAAKTTPVRVQADEAPAGRPSAKEPAPPSAEPGAVSRPATRQPVVAVVDPAAISKSPPSADRSVDSKPAAPSTPVAKLASTTASPAVPTSATQSAARSSAPKPPQATAPNGTWTLQLGASLNREDAERQASRLREKGYAPYIVSAEVPGKGTWYRVRMGTFPSKDAATRYLQDFKRETQAEAFVASTQ